jgi:16S rRNA (guanine527-N7)-methyltransferase
MSRLIDFNSFRDLFAKGGMDVNEREYSCFERYAELLCNYNEKVNLTAITDPEGIAVKHFYDSVYPFTLVDVPCGTSLVDVGTGAGFPSIPLKIIRSDIDITMLDSLNKRVKFLQEVSDELSLGAKCIHGRAEEIAAFSKKGNSYRESYDVATARAVANLRDLCEYCLPFVKVGGIFAALKGKDGLAELETARSAIEQLGGEVEMSKGYELPNGDGRYIIVIRKVKATPQKYPRNSGQIKKNPLK